MAGSWRSRISSPGRGGVVEMKQKMTSDEMSSCRRRNDLSFCLTSPAYARAVLRRTLWSCRQSILFPTSITPFQILSVYSQRVQSVDCKCRGIALITHLESAWESPSTHYNRSKCVLFGLVYAVRRGSVQAPLEHIPELSVPVCIFGQTSAHLSTMREPGMQPSAFRFSDGRISIITVPSF